MINHAAARFTRFLFIAILASWLAPHCIAQGFGAFPPSSSGATSCSATGANWLNCTISGPILTLGAATGQTSHQVIGTCGSATSFAPCSLVAGDIPTIPLSSGVSGTLQAAQEPAHTGDCTNTAGNLAMTCTKTNGVSFAASATTDATNASNIGNGTLGFGRLPTPTGGGPAGVVAALTAATGTISNTAAQVIGYAVPTGTLAVGTTYTIEAWGSETTSTSPGNDTFSIEIGSTSLSGNVIVSAAAAATASVTTLPIWIRATVTVFPSAVSGGMVVCATSSGALSGTCKTAILNTATVTAGQSNVIELVYQSGASTSSINFTLAKITLEKP
ncbi:MAG: hypothetical protein ABSF64_35320 [Bryobacteraceae bacterium]